MGESEKIDSGQKLVYHILLRPEVYSDLKESFQWYSDQHEILGMEFIEQIESCFERIKSNPYSYQLIKKNLRRAIVRKFPFGIFYQIENNEIIIFAIFHLSRLPGNVKRRR
ncbi:MAG: type II toxin-antitoxin system RelE/ParE family toxin [Ignavibacteria bacterium]|nr:type II toxin-antitoxin system RelE/ParE family toxin [Ignavibacteria bacterium]